MPMGLQPFGANAQGEDRLGKRECQELARRALREHARLTEGMDAEGRLWKVCLIQPGVSLNGVRYGREVLEVAAPLFEGVKAYSDHATKREMQERPERSVRDIVGWFDGVQVTESGLMGRFHVCDNVRWLRELLLDCYTYGRPDLIGFSIDAVAEGHQAPDGRTFIVDRLLKVRSVDVVTEPAAGGRIVDLVASISEESETMPTLPRPITADAVASMSLAVLRELPDGELQAVMEDPDVLGALRDLVAQKPLLKSLLAGLLGNGAGEISEQDPQRLLECRLRQAESKILLKEALAEVKNLPTPIIKKIERAFSGRMFSPTELYGAIREEREVYARLLESGAVRGCGGGKLEVGMDEREKVIKALDGFFANEDLEGVARFRSFREAYIAITGDSRISGSLREARRLTEAMTTASWAEILGDSITRRMLAEYRASNLNKWRRIVSDIVPLQDFRTQRRVRYGGYGTLPTVSENNAYTALTSPSDEEATYSPAKRGGTETLTLEMIKNDDVGAIRRIPTRLARAAAQTLHRFVFDMIRTNALIYDGKALFHADHSNLLTQPLSDTALFNAYTAMVEQTAYGDSSDILELEPRLLLAPPELVKLAYQLINSPQEVGTADNQLNFHNTYNLEVLMVGYWTDSNNWYLVANPADVPTIEIGFLDGQEEPELFVQDLPNVGSMFNNDQITYKIRHIYGGAVLDYRGFQGSIVA